MKNKINVNATKLFTVLELIEFVEKNGGELIVGDPLTQNMYKVKKIPKPN